MPTSVWRSRDVTFVLRPHKDAHCAHGCQLGLTQTGLPVLLTKTSRISWPGKGEARLALSSRWLAVCAGHSWNGLVMSDNCFRSSTVLFGLQWFHSNDYRKTITKTWRRLWISGLFQKVVKVGWQDFEHTSRENYIKIYTIYDRCCSTTLWHLIRLRAE
jgi:hypothetical protein